MNKNSQEFTNKFNNLILELMQSQYADLENNNNTIYTIPSKELKVDIRSNAFYFDLDRERYHQVSHFKGYGIKQGHWRFPSLGFSIIMTSNSGRTYSYPRLRKMPVENDDDLILFVTYIFSCVNTAINFFDCEY